LVIVVDVPPSEGGDLGRVHSARRLLRRFSTLSVVDASFRLYGEALAPALALSLLSAVPAALGWFGLGALASHLDAPAIVMRAVSPGATAAGVPLTTALAFAVSAIAFGAVTSTAGSAGAALVVSAVVRGERPRLGEAVHAAARAGWPLAIGTLVVALLSVMGFALAVVPAFLVLVSCAFVGPVAVIEGVGPLVAIRRSLVLTRGRRGKVAATLLLCGLVVASATSAFATVGTVAGFLGDGAPGAIANALLTQLIVAAGTPVLYIGLALLYFDARVEIEGLDAQFLITGSLALRGGSWQRRH
jgi:hypothetical protein